MKLKIFLIAALVSTLNSIGQSANESSETFSLNPWEDINGVRIAASYYRNFEFEASYIITSYPQTQQGFGGMGMPIQFIGAGVEYVNFGNQNAVGAKLSYEVSCIIFSGQIAADVLLSDDSPQYRIMPKIGFSAFGLAMLYYGWNINLRKESGLNPPTHTLTLQVNIFDK